MKVVVAWTPVSSVEKFYLGWRLIEYGHFHAVWRLLFGMETFIQYGDFYP